MDLNITMAGSSGVAETLLVLRVTNYSNKDFTIKTLCEKVDKSYSYINELCWENLKLKPSIILENARLEYVLIELKNGFTTVKEIAGKAGFRKARTFRSVFKKRIGINASNCIRQMNKNNRDEYVGQLIKKLWKNDD